MNELPNFVLEKKKKKKKNKTNTKAREMSKENRGKQFSFFFKQAAITKLHRKLLISDRGKTQVIHL